jgi:hypothetical protein
MNFDRVPNFATTLRLLLRQLQYSIIAFLLVNVCFLRAFAEDFQSHERTHQHHQLTSEQKANQSALLKIVRDATERFKDVSVAEAEGYALQFGCVSGDTEGAMGLHYVNGDLVNKGVLDATHPQIVIYEAMPNGHLRLIGADYLLFQAPWDAANPGAPPQLMGQAFHLFDAPNRFALPAFYTLHVWAWKENPNGAFVNWHPDVSCEAFSGKMP